MLGIEYRWGQNIKLTPIGEGRPARIDLAAL
jgi:hypothetical protein